MGWGLDAHWAALAREHGWRCGVIDAVAIGHRAAPAAAAYSREAAIAEARAFLAERPYVTRGRGAAHARDASPPGGAPVRALVVAEFYPSRRDPVLGIWAHRQALAARDAGAEVRVLVLHRLVPPRSSLSPARRRRTRARASSCASRARRRATGCRSPTSPTSRRRASAPTRVGRLGGAAAGGWRCAAAPLVSVRPRPRPQRRAGRRRRAPRVRAACRRAPLVISVHGGDVLYTASRVRAGAQAVRASLGAAQLVLANSQGIAELSRAARRARDRASCISAPTCRPPRARRGAAARRRS